MASCRADDVLFQCSHTSNAHAHLLEKYPDTFTLLIAEERLKLIFIILCVFGCLPSCTFLAMITCYFYNRTNTFF